MNRNSIVMMLALLASVNLFAQDAERKAERKGAMIHKLITLSPGKKGNPFTLYFPIELTEVGEIRTFILVDDIDPDKGQLEPLHAIIVDARAFKEIKPEKWRQWCQKANKYNPAEWVAGDKIRRWVKGVKGLFGKKQKAPSYFHGLIRCGKKGQGESIKHAVDSPELLKTVGKYVVIIRNVMPAKVSAHLLISYPGKVWDFDPEVYKNAKVKPDLQIEEVSLNKDKKLTVKIVNKGVGRLHQGFWHEKRTEAVTLTAKVGERSYGVTLQSFDPKKLFLNTKQAELTYVFDKVVINDKTKVSVTIDATEKIYESNEKNNTKEVELGHRVISARAKVRTGRNKPDLVISDIRLNADNIIEVVIENRGKGGIRESLWRLGQSSPMLQLRINGNGWADTALLLYDKNKLLAKAGGKLVYSTGYKLKQAVKLSAEIDYNKNLNESNETNNKLEKMLNP